MTTTTATIIAAIITATGAITAALITKGDLWPLFKRAKFNLKDRSWHGWSVYVPLNGYQPNSECVYRFSADIKQFGRMLWITETIEEFFDINMTKLEGHPIRNVTGKGSFQSDRDIIINFNEQDSLTCGTMLLTVDTYGKRLEGTIAVRFPTDGKSVPVTIVLGRPGVNVSHTDLPIDKIKAMF